MMTLYAYPGRSRDLARYLDRYGIPSSADPLEDTFTVDPDDLPPGFLSLRDVQAADQ